MSDYLPSFIVQPVLRQARRFSERIGGEDSPAGATASSFSLPAVPDFQRFYPTRFWTQSPPLAVAGGSEGLGVAGLEHGDVVEESTLRSIARNIHLWASQINNLDVDDEVIQEPVLRSVEQDDPPTEELRGMLTEEPGIVDTHETYSQLPAAGSTQETGSQSLPIPERLRQPQRTASETSMNPAHELSYRSRMLERNAQGRSQSDPFAALNVPQSANTRGQDPAGAEDEPSVYARGSHGSGMLPEDDGMKPLRQRIVAVWAGPGTAQEKSQLVHSLMMERYRSNHNIVTPTSSATATSPPFRATSPLSLGSIKSEETIFNLSPTDILPTYAPLDIHDEPDEVTGELPKPDLGCIHYKRNVKMQCATCEKWYTCRVCHDEKETHELPRRETKHMLCMVCSTPQRVSQVCKVCHVQAACYYCAICKLWNNDANKSIYHCDDCGICRLGQGLGKDFFHCKTCAACMNISVESTHRCIEKSTKCDCPICGEFMFTSIQPVMFMHCGHSIHDSCFIEWCDTSYKCPICSKSIANMESQFRRLDRHIEEQPMPDEYSHNRAYVFCNDCNDRSIVKYHWLGLKCGNCDSYNTAQLELLGPESPAIQERADRAIELGMGEASMTASQVQTPNEDFAPPLLRSSSSHPIPATISSITWQDSAIGTPRSIPSAPARRDSPFHNLPHSPSRSLRAVSPVVSSYFGTGQRPPPSENRRGSYFSVLSFGAATEDHALLHTHPPLNRTRSSSSQPRHPSQLSQSHLSPPQNLPSHTYDVNPRAHNADQMDDDDMDFWGGHSPRSHDADIVDLDLENGTDDPNGEVSSSEEDEDEDMDYDDDDEEDDPMDVFIGHR